MRYERGIEARAVCRDEAGRTLLVAGSDGALMLPGGRVRHGENPSDTLARTAGLVPRRPLRAVTSIDRTPGGWRGGWRHIDTIVFDAEPPASTDGSWLAPAELTALPPDTARALGLPVRPARGRGPRRRSWSANTGSRLQRFAAYGLVTDPNRNVLLTLISSKYPGSGRWHLAGGGTDFGETVEAALHREVLEESGQTGEIGDLLYVSHRHDTRHHGGPVDWHGVRVVFAFRVPHPSTPRVLELGGSTEAAEWFPLERARTLPLTEVAETCLSLLTDRKD
jgi:ADP-ribose pyrophosphatase YjhB (NUDIX family)